MLVLCEDIDSACLTGCTALQESLTVSVVAVKSFLKIRELTLLGGRKGGQPDPC